MKLGHISPLLRQVTEDELIELCDLGYDEGFRKIKKLIDRYVEANTERLVWDPHLLPEDRSRLAEEIRLFQGISELPVIAKQKCIANS